MSPPTRDPFILAPPLEEAMERTRRRLTVVAWFVLAELGLVSLHLWLLRLTLSAPPVDLPAVPSAVQHAIWFGVVLFILAGTAVEERVLGRPVEPESTSPQATLDRVERYRRVRLGFLGLRGLAGLAALWLGLGAAPAHALALAMSLALLLDHLFGWPRKSALITFVEGVEDGWRDDVG